VPRFAAIASMAARSSALTVSSESRWPVWVAPRGEHRKRIRRTNLLERSFVEVRRRTKVVGRFPGEASALCLIWAVLKLSSRGWRGVVMTPRAVSETLRPRPRRPLRSSRPDHHTVTAAAKFQDERDILRPLLR
jgi:transposase-like protein